MEIKLSIHLHHHFEESFVDLFRNLLSIGVTIMAKQEEAAVELDQLKAQLTKASEEIKARIQALVDAAEAAQNVTPELQSAIDGLKPIAQALDDINPDAPSPLE